MKGLNLFLLCALALSMTSPLLAKKEEKKGGKRSFWQKHKGKIKAGIAIAALVGAAIALTYHGKKTKKAVDNAEVPSEYYGDVIAIVGLLGPIGPDRTIKFLTWAHKTNMPLVGEKIVSDEDIAMAIVTNADNALAYYFYPDSEMDRLKFKAKLVGIIPSDVLDTVRAMFVGAAQEVAQGLKKLGSKIKNNLPAFLK